jgi:hypothetical protein
MKDANGQEFKSNNPVLIKKIKDLVLREIKQAIDEAEAEVMAMA